jgi:hypothetical protein
VRTGYAPRDCQKPHHSWSLVADARGDRLMLQFSVLFCLNIVVGNASLRFVNISFNQVHKPNLRNESRRAYCCFSR